MTTVYQTSTASSVLVATATNEVSLAASPGATNTILTTGSIAASASNVYYATFTIAGPGTTDWTVGANFDAVFDVTTCTSTVSYAGNTQRIDVTTAAQRASTIAATQTGTGLKSFTLAFSTAAGSGVNDNALRASTDLYMLTARASNSSSMTAGSLAFRVDNSNVTANVYWTVGGATTKAPPPWAALDRRNRRNTLLRR